MPYLKKISLIILILLFLAQLIIIIPNIIAVLQINILNFNTDKNEYFTDENIIIEASWDLNYNPIEEWAYVQIQLYNNLDQILWCSEQNDSMGIINKTWDINIIDLNFNFSENSINFSVIFYLFHIVGEEIIFSGPIAIKSIQISKKLISCSLFNYTEKINYGESISFQALFYNITKNETYYPDNLSITLELYKANKSIFSQNYNTVNGSINITISTSTFLIVGQIELKLIASENFFYFGNIFSYDLEVEKLNLLCSLSNYTEKINYGESISFQALFYNITKNETYYPDNLLVTLEIYKQKELVYDEQYNTINGLIYITISTLTFPIIGEFKLNLITPNDNIYFNQIFTYSLKVQRLGINYSINEYNHNVKYNEDTTINIRFFNHSNGQIRYLEIINISVRIFSNNTLIYKSFYNSNKNGTLIIVIPSEIFEESGEKLIYIDIYNNLYYKDLSINLTLVFNNNQNENNLIFTFGNVILIFVISLISGAGTLFIFQRKRKFNKNIFEITFKH